MRSIVAVFAALLLTLGTASAAIAQEATPQPPLSLLEGLGYQPLVLTTDGTDFTLPGELTADRYIVVLQNTGDRPVDIEIIRLPEGTTMDDLLAGFEQAQEGVPPDFFYEDVVFNGGVTADAGQSGQVVLDLPAGEWVFNLYSFDEAAGEEINLPRTVTVTGEMPDLIDPPDAVQIGMVEFDFTIPDNIAAGPQVWQVTNEGAQPHHLILSRVPDGTTEQQVLDLVAMFFAPPEATPVMGGTPIPHDLDPAATPVGAELAFEDVEDVLGTPVLSSGWTNWYEVDLAPGTYAAICFIPDRETGEPHVMLGMLEVFTVE